MSDAAIRALVEENPGQATFDEYELVHDVVLGRSPCKMLVFGTGRDSTLWLEANRDGRTAFLEDVVEWADLARGANPGIEVHAVRYRFRRFMWSVMRSFERRLFMNDLPAAVEDTAWDVILVDAPRGTRWYHAGRMTSIYTASRLGGLSGGTDIFVHDCHRRVEMECSDQFLGHDRMVAQAGSMRHYRTD